MFQVLCYIGRKCVFMGLFFKKDDSNTYGGSYNSTPNSWSSLSSSQDDTQDDEYDDEYDAEYDDEYDAEYDIEFNHELSTGALILNIIDEDGNFAGYVTVSATKDITVLPSAFGEFDEEDIRYLEEKATKFANSL